MHFTLFTGLNNIRLNVLSLVILCFVLAWLHVTHLTAYFFVNPDFFLLHYFICVLFHHEHFLSHVNYFHPLATFQTKLELIFVLQPTVQLLLDLTLPLYYYLYLSTDSSTAFIFYSWTDIFSCVVSHDNSTAFTTMLQLRFRHLSLFNILTRFNAYTSTVTLNPFRFQVFTIEQQQQKKHF